MRQFGDDYTIRRLTLQDAHAITELSEAIAGRADQTALCNPQELLDLNESGSLISIIALDRGRHIAGYYALSRPDADRIAAIGVPVIVGHHTGQLIEAMHEVLEREALSIGLLGVSSEVPIDDDKSPAVYDRFGYHLTGLIFGASADAEAEQHRRYTTHGLYFKYLVPPPRVEINVLDYHRPIIDRIYAALGRELISIADRAASRVGRLDSQYVADRRQGVIQVREPGFRTGDEAAEICRSLCASGAAVVRLEMPLNQPQAGAVCSQLEGLGFAFAGIKPSEGADLLVMQFLATPTDIPNIKMENALAVDLFEYAVGEIRRVNSNAARR
ncbi:MAG TPA: hypothetical protein VJ728_14080 [Candidatus Binataceae bacterium]|nr:hypothetical protein [Candidatus Binataceae bacterium]